MHYKNGREAKNGDKVVMEQNGKLYTGILFDAVAGNDYCNGILAPLPQTSYCNLKECLHMDDVRLALKAYDEKLASAVTENVPEGVQTA